MRGFLQKRSTSARSEERKIVRMLLSWDTVAQLCILLNYVSLFKILQSPWYR